MATTPATPSNAGATTAADWKAAANSAYTAATQASVAQLEAKNSLKYANGQVAYANEILNDPTSTAAEKADAQIRLKENTEKQTQAQVALATATEQRAKAAQSYDEANAQAAKNTDPQAASTPAPASTTPNQPATSYTVTPPNAPVVSSDTKNVTPSDDPSWDAPAEFSGATKSTPGNSSDFADPKPFTEPTRGTTTVVENTTGGGSTTITRGAVIDTPASLAAKQQRDAANQSINAYSLDPNDPTERKFLDSNLRNGVITQQQYDENLSLTAEQRDAKLTQAYADSTAASKTIAQTQTMGPDIVTRQENPNTTTTTVTDIQPKTADSTVLSGEVTGTNVSTTELGGATYQTVSNADGTTSYTNQITGTSNTINDSSTLDKKTVDENTNGRPLTLDEINQAKAALIAGNNNNEGTGTTKKYITDEDGQTTLVAVDGVPVTPVQPQKQVDEFDGIDAQVAANEAAANQSAAENARLTRQNTNLGLITQFTREQATLQDKANFNAKADWRVRLSLAPGADYLYAAPNPGILAPLVGTDGVIFPYTPGISVAYAAQYDATTLTHSNYKYYTYNSSSVDQITLSCDFTAQDVFEANYLLAVIHFFRSMTKMFYGQDQNPKNGTPPPLCYLYGLGAFQFDKHPLVIQGFTYSLPTDVDYIRAGDSSSLQSTSRTKANSKPGETRMAMAGIQPGATVAPPQFSGAYRVLEPTYVPTKIQLSITAVPIVSRNDISNNFSLKNYATGSLLRGSERLGGGFW